MTLELLFPENEYSTVMKSYENHSKAVPFIFHNITRTKASNALNATLKVSKILTPEIVPLILHNLTKSTVSNLLNVLIQMYVESTHLVLLPFQKEKT